MPYRLNPKNHREVQVYRNGKWMKLKIHATTQKAQKHLAALKYNVEDKE